VGERRGAYDWKRGGGRVATYQPDLEVLRELPFLVHEDLCNQSKLKGAGRKEIERE
jgi:hypothetical protein